MQPNGMSKERFISATSDAGWASIDDLVCRLDDAEFWTDDFIASSLEAHKKAWIRREIKSVRDKTGWPVFASVTTHDPETGDEHHIYKQEAMFDRDDYAQVFDYHLKRASYHKTMADGYAERAERRFDMQLRLLVETVEL